MAFLNETFKTDDLPESGSYDPIPAGWYTAEINGADLKDTKAGDGQYIAIRFDITGPSHEGRVVFGNLNIRNPNPKAEEIGRRQLGDLLRAIGLAQVSDTDQLLGGALQVKLGISRSEEYGDRNEVKGFKALAGSAAPKPLSAPQPTTRAAPAAGGARPPWQR